MSLSYQILNPVQISVPCIYPHINFNYNFKLFNGDLFKVNFEPYPMNIEERFYQATIDYRGIIGGGHMFVDKAKSCDTYPGILMEFNWNNTEYKLEKINSNFVVQEVILDTSNQANEQLTCGLEADLSALSFSDSGKQFQFVTQQSSCPAQVKYASLGIAVDCSVSQQSKNDINAITQEVLANLAKTNVAFGKFYNVHLVLSDLDIRLSCSQTYTSPTDSIKDGEFDKWNIPCFNNYPIMQRISDFSKWRGSRKDKIDVWHLYSTCASDSKVGLAWPSAVCNTGATAATGNYMYSGTSISTRQQSSWKVMAHEIAHNFGAIHDCLTTCDSSCHTCSSNCDCAGKYLMNPNQNVATDDFSPGTIQDVCNTIPSFTCLKSDASLIYEFAQNKCGNGVVDPGEECDCGDLCDSDTCCTNTCKLKPTAQCSDKNQACCNQCKFKPKDTICRLKESVCDSEEKCTGNSGNCPADSYDNDGSSCTDGSFSGNCASKYCTSPDKQCTDANPLSTGACTGFGAESNDCILTCNLNGGCAQFQSFLIDGTICGGGFGNCEAGSCQYSSSCNQHLCRGSISRICKYI
eukprot:NODE_63_length_26141_cov_1.022656.p2 type:complete len:577 gc:universal NODE_63_length_26141_cov_1.022656:18585-20315(+)